MNETTTEKKQYRNAPLADAEYYAKPRWHEVAISEKSGNLCLTVLWDVCDKDGRPGNFDMNTGEETHLPDGADSWEAVAGSYVIAFAEEAKTLAKCKGKDLEYLKDICPKTYKNMKRLLEWCPDWDVKRAMWFTDCREAFYRNVVRVTVVHEEWNGKSRAKAKWTNAKERTMAETDTTEARQSIAARFGGFFDVRESAPAPKKAERASAPAPAPAAPPPAPSAPAEAPASTKNDCWAAYCRAFGAQETAEWFRLIKEFGKRESEFTPGDWHRLRQKIEDNAPF